MVQGGLVMEVIKYEHACFTAEQNGDVLVVDPGELTTDFIVPEKVVAIVVTHEHPDHFDHDHIAAIIDKNPDAIIIAPKSVTDKVEVFETRPVSGGDSVTVGVFDLEFYGKEHEVIHPSVPPVENIGVLVNELLYYPGDSFTIPDKAVDTLALPIGAPWLRFKEAGDFLVAIKPRLAFPTHDGVLSNNGRSFMDSWCTRFADSIDCEFTRIDGLSIEV